MRETGLNSGFMIPQYTTAALVSENKSFCFPASADSIPTSLGQEDVEHYVSGKGFVPTEFTGEPEIEPAEVPY